MRMDQPNKRGDPSLRDGLIRLGTDHSPRSRHGIGANPAIDSQLRDVTQRETESVVTGTQAK